MYPRYQYPRELLLKVPWAVLFKQRRDFHVDARRCIEGLQPPLRVLGVEHLPQRGPCVVVMNHYYRSGFGVWWLSMAISALLPMPHTWIMSAQWTAPGQWYEPFKEWYSGLMSRRLAHVYGFLRMPPMPPRQKEVTQRAASVRAALRYVEKTPEPVLCVAPEGHDILKGGLAWPPPGGGRFLMLLNARGLPFVPVGGWEGEEALTVHFGPAFNLPPAADSSPDARDRAAAGIVMSNIACLLPEPLRGDFA